jgi:hypothetical protein
MLASGATSSAGPREPTAVLSATTVPLGNTFELRVRVPVPPASAVYFPDELPTATALESHGKVQWKAQVAADGATLTLTYPLIAFGTGNVQVPGLDVFVGPAHEAVGGDSLPGGSVAEPSAGAHVAPPASSLLASIAPREVHVASVFELEGVLAGVGPMPAADVVGRNWHLLSLILLFVFSLVFGEVLIATIRRRMLLRSGGDASVLTTHSAPEDARCAALKELDELVQLGLHTNGRTREFYTLSSEIVRRYVGRLDSRLGPDLTSTELMQALRARGDSSRVDGLASQMRGAEVMKFGRLRPEAGAAEAHWRALREWVEDARNGIREL